MLPIIGGVVVGAIAAIAAPSLVSGVASGVRALTKEVVKGGIAAYTATSEFVSESGEQFQDLVAEAKSEVKHAKQTNVEG
jgi:type II secretory pathway pseudopilin PulG